MANFFSKPKEVAALCVPFRVYCRKLAIFSATIAMKYSSVDNSSQMLAITVLLSLNKYMDEKKFIELSIKKAYFEFTKEARSGGGGFNVQDGLRIAMNAFCELLALDFTVAYQLGF